MTYYFVHHVVQAPGRFSRAQVRISKGGRKQNPLAERGLIPLHAMMTLYGCQQLLFLSARDRSLPPEHVKVAGSDSVEVHELEHDIQNDYFICRS